ncbi:prepilin peptidase [Specibacter sp. NPDC078692]|uniref:prepilin peptidase n=1 Tax=Specibacter sp. NPDC078692 TaxID=3155818 RepID=UPI003426EA05
MTEDAMPRNYLGREIARMKASDGINPAVATTIMVATAVALLIILTTASNGTAFWAIGLLLGVTAFQGGRIGVTDARTHRIPDALSIPYAGTVAATIITATIITNDWSRFGQAALGALALGLLYLLAAIFGDLGLGDVKLAAILGGALAYAGWTPLLWGSLLGLVLGLPHALILHFTQRRAIVPAGETKARIPLGPYMVAGTVITLALALTATGI